MYLTLETFVYVILYYFLLVTRRFISRSLACLIDCITTISNNIEVMSNFPRSAVEKHRSRPPVGGGGRHQLQIECRAQLQR